MHRFLAPEGPMQTVISKITPHARNPDGRSSLRLVKLRLVLTLVAVAVLPLAALAPVIRTIVDDPRVAQHERLAAQSEHVAAEVRRELDGIRLAVGAVAADPSLPAAIVAKPNSNRTKAADALLAALVARPSGVIAAVALVDPSGVIRAKAGDGAIPLAAAVSDAPLPPGPGDVAYSVIDGVAGGPASLSLALAVPGPKGAPPLGAVVASVPLDTLLEWADEDLNTVGQHLAFAADGGQPLAMIATHASPTGGDQPILELSGVASAQATGAADLAVPGLAGLSIVASAPLTVASIPLPALVTMVVLLLLLIVTAAWMGRKILEPAAELEAQRNRFQGLYHTEREAALMDSLTGLGNHRAFHEAVAQMVDQARRYGTKFSLVLLDIDEFKRVNDTRGHAVGDELLAEVGELIRSTIRTADAGFRIGGDEFAILLAGTGPEGAEVTARRILSRGLGARGSGRYKGAISFSAGITACPQFGRTRVELTTQADAALYRGKRGGRTIVTVFDPEQDRGHVDEGMRSELSSAIASVIEAGSLTPVYQPIIHLPTGRILGYEGLVRVDAASGFANTGALFDAAEMAGRVLDLDRAALDVVLRGAHNIPRDTLVSLNVSPRSFEAPEFTAAVFLAILKRHGMDPGRVLLELTERDAIRDPERLRTTVQTLQEAGVRVAADDVGAGNAGLRLLSLFRFDVVKIDLSLVQGNAGQDQAANVLTSLVGLARRWGSLTIAEGVETAAQLQMIRQLDVDAAQGYLLGRPGPILDISGIDLDALAGPVPEGTPQATGQARPAISFEVATGTAPTLSGLPMPPVPTAASVIAGNGPSLFGAR
jgi:diguanylate cyclase (GGDEF)-like protein